MSDTAKQLDALLQRMAEEKTLSPEALKKIGEVREHSEGLETQLADARSTISALTEKIQNIRDDNDRLKKAVSDLDDRSRALDELSTGVSERAKQNMIDRAKLEGEQSGIKFVKDFCMKLVSNSVLKRNVMDHVTGSHPVWQSYDGNGYINHQSMSETHDTTTTEEIE